MGRVVHRADPSRPRLEVRRTAEQDARQLLVDAGMKVKCVPLGGACPDAVLWVDIGGNARTTPIAAMPDGKVLLGDPLPGFVVFD